MVNKPGKNKKASDNGIPMQMMNQRNRRLSSTESSNGVDLSPTQASEKALIPGDDHGVVLSKQKSKSRPPLSNIGFRQESSIDDDKSYSSIPLSPATPNDEMLTSTHSAGTMTLTGTIRRGQKPIQVQLQLTEQEMKELTRSNLIDDDKKGDCIWGVRKGIHIFFLSVLFIPFAFISSLCMCFYVGTMCWYNIYMYFSEEKTVWHKIFLCPLLILFYPFLIVILSLCIAIFSSVKQISWYFSSWYKEIKDFDKGFFGAVCNKLSIPQCAPYEVVILDEQLSPSENSGGLQTNV